MTSKPASAISSQARRGSICLGSSGNHTPHWSGHTPMVNLEYFGLAVLTALDIVAGPQPTGCRDQSQAALLGVFAGQVGDNVTGLQLQFGAAGAEQFVDAGFRQNPS